MTAERRIDIWIILVGLPCSSRDYLPRRCSLAGSWLPSRTNPAASCASASVRVSSPALIGGTASAVTNERGQCRFVSLPAGMYTLEVELASFAPYREDDIEIRVQANLERTTMLRLRAIAESISVQGGSAVDPERSGMSERFGPRRRLPRSRSAASACSISSGRAGRFADVAIERHRHQRVRVRFERERESVSAGRHQFHMPVLWRAAASAGRRRHPGSPRRFAWRIGGIRQHPGRRVQRRDQARREPFRTGLLVLRPDTGPDQPSGPTPLRHAAASRRPEYTRVRYRDFTTHLGGPLVRNRAWFFAGYQYLRDSDSQPGTDPLFPREQQVRQGLRQSDLADQPAHEVDEQFPRRVLDQSAAAHARAAISDTTVVTSGTRPTATFGQLTDTLTNNTLLDVRVSRFVAPRTNDPATGDRTTPNHVDMATGIQSGGPAGIRCAADWSGRRWRRASAEYRSFLGADHEMKFGAQVEQGQNSGWTAFQGGVVSYTDNAGQPVQATFRQPSTSGGEFVTDGDCTRWTPSDLPIGSRQVWDCVSITTARSARICPHMMPGKRDGSHHRRSRNALHVECLLAASRRHSEAHRRRQDVMRAKLRPFPSRHSHGRARARPSRIDADDDGRVRFERPVSIRASSPSSIRRSISGWIRTRSRRRPIRSASEWNGNSPAASLDRRVVRAKGRQPTSSAGPTPADIYEASTRTLPDGQIVPVFVFTNGTAARRFLLTNPPDYFLRYNGMVLRSKSAGRTWQALCVIHAVKDRRTPAVERRVPVGTGQFSSTFGNGNTFGRDPNTLTNATGQACPTIGRTCFG